jgi:hypothetical protein
MSQDPKEEPFHEAHLDSPEYRDRLMRKLNCLIAVLEVATAKVRRSLAGPDPDVERLTRIRNNLQSTLEVCMRARSALERREALPKELPENLSRIIQNSGLSGSRGDELPTPRLVPLPRGADVELSSLAERERFERMGKIDAEQIADVDMEDLTRRLQAG